MVFRPQVDISEEQWLHGTLTRYEEFTDLKAAHGTSCVANVFQSIVVLLLPVNLADLTFGTPYG